jgi:aquaporin Z
MRRGHCLGEGRGEPGFDVAARGFAANGYGAHSPGHYGPLTLIHLVSIPVTNTSMNPARSTGPALVAGGAALGQLWLFREPGEARPA